MYVRKNSQDKCNLEDLTCDDKIEYWHTHETGNSLREFLGMTKEEYLDFVLEKDRKITEGKPKVDVREKLVEILKQAPFEGKVLDEWWWEEKIMRIADHLITHGVTVQEWISVKDRLPEECPHPYDDITKAVLIYTPVDGYTHIGWYAGKDYRGRDEWKTLSAMRSYQTCTKKVSHWCYLPKPPKGE